MEPKQLQFALGNLHDCDYLPGRSAQSAFLIADRENPSNEYANLIQYGFRRSGDWVYRPHCPACQSCIPVRVRVEQFAKSRKQKRIWEKNADLRVQRKAPLFDRNHYDLYQRYLNARHPGGAMSLSGPEEYIEFLGSHWAETAFYEFRLDGRVVLVAVVDDIGHALSAVYTFFDPDFTQRSLGGYAILWEIEQSLNFGYRYLYLGYWISECRKMAYKTEYRPIEVLVDGQWRLINSEKIVV